jgi:hypothetical protein
MLKEQAKHKFGGIAVRRQIDIHGVCTDANEIPNMAVVLHMTILLFLVRSVDHASFVCKITNSMHCLSSVY